MADDYFEEVKCQKEQIRQAWEQEAERYAFQILKCAIEGRYEDATSCYVSTVKALAFAKSATSFHGSAVQEAEAAVKQAQERVNDLL